jgi:hypothetical protein
MFGVSGLITQLYGIAQFERRYHLIKFSLFSPYNRKISINQQSLSLFLTDKANYAYEFLTIINSNSNCQIRNEKCVQVSVSDCCLIPNEHFVSYTMELYD